MKHTNSTAAFARGPSLTPEDFDVERQTQQLVVRLTDPHMDALGESTLRHKVYRYRRDEDRACPFVAIDTLMIALANDGASEAELMEVEFHFIALRQMLTCGNAHRELGDLHLEETSHESAENEATAEIHIFGATAERLEKAALAKRKEAATELELAGQMERAARRLRRRQNNPPGTGNFMRPLGAIAAAGGR